MVVRSLILIAIVGGSGIAAADSIPDRTAINVYKRAPGPEQTVLAQDNMWQFKRGTANGPNSVYTVIIAPGAGHTERTTFTVGKITRTEAYTSTYGRVTSESTVERTGKHPSKITVTRWTGLFGRVHEKVTRE